jgi:hypothetical protein
VDRNKYITKLVVAGFSGVVVFLFLSGAADFFLRVGGFL